MCRHLQYLVFAIAATCTLAAGQQRPFGTAASLPQPRQEPLTDRDVIQMVKSGKLEADIVATIRSSRTNFDLSGYGCGLLTMAHVSRTILNAMAPAGRPPCVSTSELSKPQTGGTGTLLSNGNGTLLADRGKQTKTTAAAPSSGGDRVALNPQPLPPRTAAKSGAGSPGANVAQKTAAVSDYRQPPGNKVPSGLRRTVLSGRVLLPPGSRPAGPQHPPTSSSVKTSAPARMVKAQPAGSAPLEPGQTMSAHNRSTSPTNSTNSIAAGVTNVRPPIAAAAYYPGTIEGYVYWDSHWGGGWCGSVSITVSVAQKPNVYTSLGTLGNFAEYVGTVGYNEGDGVVGSVTVCKYTYPNVPIGQDLQVHIDLGPFSLSVSPTNPTVAPINIPKISNIKCGMSSPNAALAQPSLSQKDLNSNWEICGNSAYKVNFMTSPVVWI